MQSSSVYDCTRVTLMVKNTLAAVFLTTVASSRHLHIPYIIHSPRSWQNIPKHIIQTPTYRYEISLLLFTTYIHPHIKIWRMSNPISPVVDWLIRQYNFNNWWFTKRIPPRRDIFDNQSRYREHHHMELRYILVYTRILAFHFAQNQRSRLKCLRTNLSAVAHEVRFTAHNISRCNH